MSTQKNVVKGLIASALMAIANAMVNAGVGTDIHAFLHWISMGAGAVLIASVLIHTLLRLIPKWEEKATKALRHMLVLVLAIGLVLGADALLQHPDLVERIEPIYKIVFLTLLVWQGIQVRNSYMKSS